MRQLILDQQKKYPQSKLTDLVKFLYQSIFGCGHFVSDPEKTLARLKSEYQSCDKNGEPLFTPLGGGFCRLNLSALSADSLSMETVNRLFVYSAQKTGSMDSFRQGLDLLEEMIANGDLPYSLEEWRRYRTDYEAAGCPAVSHSEVYRAAYAPAYRVLTDSCRQYWPLFCAIEKEMKKRARTVLAIDGGSGTGKSHLSALLEQIFPAAVVHMDDFFLQPHQRTPQRFAEPGGNLDYERFAEEIVPHFGKNESFSYRVFDCSCGKLGGEATLSAAPLLILEGVYSQHPLWQDKIHLKVFLDASRSTRLTRILARNGQWMLQRFEKEWIPREDLYFDTFALREKADLLIDTETFF